MMRFDAMLLSFDADFDSDSNGGIIVCLIILFIVLSFIQLATAGSDAAFIPLILR